MLVILSRSEGSRCQRVRSFAAAQDDKRLVQDDTSRTKRLLRPDELLEAMHTQPSYTQIIENEE